MLVAGVALAGMAVVTAQDDGPPAPPAAYYGTVTLNDAPAPAGSEIVAFVDGDPHGSIIIDTAGEYGGAGAGASKLVVEDVPNGATVTFTVNGIPTNQTVEWEPGAVQQLNLSASTTDPTQPGDDPNNGGGESGDGSTGGGDTGGASGPSGGGTVVGGQQSQQPVTPTITATAEGVSVVATDLAESRVVEADVDLPLSAGVQLTELTVEPAEPLADMEVAIAPTETTAVNTSLESAQPLSYLRVTPETFDSAAVGEATLAFTVPSETVPANSSPEYVTLYRYADGWEPVPTAYNGNGTYVATTPGFSTFAVGADTAGFRVTDFGLDAETITRGDLAVVSLTVENTGTVEGTTTLELQVDGETVADRQLTVDAGDTRAVTFTPQFQTTGNYTLSVGEQATTLTVQAQSNDASDTSTTDEASPTTELAGGPLWVLGGVVALVLLVGGAVVLGRR